MLQTYYAIDLHKPKYICLITAMMTGFIFNFSFVQSNHADSAGVVTVCDNGCEFSTIQAAVDDENVSTGAAIKITDAVHTEAGIIVNKDVTIQGQGADRTVVQAHETAGTSDERVFYITSGTESTMRGLTIRHGNPTSEPESGGGIKNEGMLTLEDVIVRDNSASAGGGILNEGTLTLINSSVDDNQARGGGLHYLECSTGGGIKVLTGEVKLVNSTVSNNSAIKKGGGIHVACQGALVLINSTISGNSANGDGGGIFVNGVGELTNSTISDNSAKSGGGIYVQSKDGVQVVHGLVKMKNSIIADNFATFEKYGVPDCFIAEKATLDVNLNNLIGDNSCNPEFYGDAMLADLSQASGSPAASVADEEGESLTGHTTQVHALLPESPAIDAIPESECAVETDQRGMARPQGKGCDIGAYELQQDNTGISNYVMYIVLLMGILIIAVVFFFLYFSRNKQ